MWPFKKLAADPVPVKIIGDEPDEDPIIKTQKSHVELQYRKAIGGWSPERAQKAAMSAEGGEIQSLADLVEAILTDDRVDGVLATRTHGLLGLPLTFVGGSEESRQYMQGAGDAPGEWWQMHDEAELVRLMAWGLVLGVGVAQRVQLPRVIGQPYRYKIETWSPRWLRYSYDHGWSILTAEGEQPIVPGDGRWILFTPYGAKKPWSWGKWNALVFPWLLKRFALEDRANHSQIMGSPFLLGMVGKGSTEKQRSKFLRQLNGLGRAGKFVLPDGWDLQIREATGRNWQIYTEQAEWADQAITITLSGQLVTTEGTTGFSSGNIHDQIKADMIRFDAERLSSTLREQSLLPWAWANHGDPQAAPWPQWETKRPKDEGDQASAIATLGDGIVKLNEALRTQGIEVDARELVSRFGVPIKEIANVTDA